MEAYMLSETARCHSPRDHEGMLLSDGERSERMVMGMIEEKAGG